MRISDVIDFRNADVFRPYANSDGLGELRELMHKAVIVKLREWQDLTNQLEAAESDLEDCEENEDTWNIDEYRMEVHKLRRKVRHALGKYHEVRRAAADLRGVPDPVALNLVTIKHKGE